MASIDFIPAGESVSAADMNLLWGEFDRRAGILFDRKSFLLSKNGGNLDRRFFGMPFYFIGEGTNWAEGFDSPWSEISYDHSIFTRNAEDLAEVSTDEDKKIITVENPSDDDYAAIGLLTDRREFFNHSLEAHKRGDYWIKERFSAFAEKVHQYSVAEIVLVNYVGTFHIEPEWNKFNFFRVHNLSERAIVFTFRDAGFGSFVVPAWGCRATRKPGPDYVAPPVVRIDSTLISIDSDTITLDSSDEFFPWNYFWETRGGDLRWWTQGPGESYGSNGNSQLLTTLRANNVTNTTLLFDFINTWDINVATDVLTGLYPNRIGWFKDPHIAAYDIGAVPTYAPIADETIIGDLLHQHGRIIYTLDNTKLEVDYKGYATLADDFSATGVSVTEDVDGNLVLTGVGTGYAEKLVSIGCNLFANGSSGTYALNHIIDLQGGPVTLDNRMPETSEAGAGPAYPNVLVYPIDALDGTTSFSDSSGNVLLDGVPYRGLQYIAKDGANPISIHVNTVAEVLNLNWVGGDALAVTDQDTESATFENRRLQWTMFGLVMLCDQVLHLGDAFSISSNSGAGVNRYATTLNSPITPLTTISPDDGVTLSNKILIVFDTWGWGNPNAPQCLAPQLGRSYSNLKTIMGETGELSIHPELFNDSETVDGADYDATRIAQTVTSIKAIQPLELVATDGGYFPVWKEPDNLRDAMNVIATGTNYDTLVDITPSVGYCPRLPMEYWQFNTLAAWVNALTRIVPMDYTFAPTLTLIRPITTLETNILPRDGFAEFGEGEIMDAFTTLGVPIYTSADFPASYQDIKDATRRLHSGGISYTDTIIDRAGAPADDGGDPGATFEAVYTMQRAFTGASFAPGDEEDIANALDIAFGGDVGRIDQYHWVKISEVKAAVEQLGWKFFYRELFIPLSLELYDVAEPTLMHDRPYTDQFTVTSTEFVDGQPHEGYYNALGATVTGGQTTPRGFGFTYSYYDKTPMFVFRPEVGSEQDWKTGALTRRKCTDFKLGDAVQVALYDAGALLPSPFGAFSYGSFYSAGFVQFDFDDEFRRSIQQRGGTYYGDWVQGIMIQKYCSDGYSVLEKAVTNPVSSIEHAFDNWSTLSLENAASTAGEFASIPTAVTPTFGAASSPLQYRARIGDAAVQSVFNNAQTYFQNTTEHSEFEILETTWPNHIIP